MKKRVFAMVLTLCILLCALPVSAGAAGGEKLEMLWGENVRGLLDMDTGVLTLSGSGPMFDFINNEPIWHCMYIPEIRDDIGLDKVSAVVIEDGITEIGPGAFSGFTALTSVTIPSSVKVIGTRAFYQCASLQSLVIPGRLDTITFIEHEAFAQCVNLGNVYVGGFIKLAMAFDEDPEPNGCAFAGDTATIHFPPNDEDMATYAEENALRHEYNCGTCHLTWVGDYNAVGGFADVLDSPGTNWYCAPIQWAAAQKITNGIFKDSANVSFFAPGNPCTRAQAVTFLWRAANCPQPNVTTTAFTDIDETAYYYDAVLWAVEKGITTGATTTTFDPEGRVTRSQMVTFLWRMNGSPAVTGSSFADVPTNEFYYNSVSWAVTNGITNGTNAAANTFEPNTTCSRAHIVTFLYRDLAE